MAYQKRYRLPPLKLTKRCGAAVDYQSIYHRNSRGKQSVPPQQQQDSVRDDPLPDTVEYEDAGEDISTPTLHGLQSQASIEGWSKVRGQVLLTAAEMCAMPENQTCLCCSEKAILRCQKCGPLVYYCHQCFLNQHKKANFFHVPEKWEVK